MKLFKLFGIAISAAALVTLCACANGNSSQTTSAPIEPAQTSAADLSEALENAQTISYMVSHDETYGQDMFYVSSLGEPVIEEGKISQLDDNGASLTTTLTTVKKGTTIAELMEEYIDRSETVLAEFPETMFFLCETSDGTFNTCHYGFFCDETTAQVFDLTFPTDMRDTYFQHVSFLVQIYTGQLDAVIDGQQ